VWPLRLGEEKKKIDRRKKPQNENIMVCPIPYGDHDNSSAVVEMGDHGHNTDMVQKQAASAPL